ncbi:MAG: hypothetical protein ACXW02_05350, partial [Halobacteriota archaeon]
RNASLEFKTNGFQVPPVGSAAITMPPELVELFVEVTQALALTATSTKTKITAIAGRFKATKNFGTAYYK